MKMHIGLDFDNTIVCYDKAITRLADELLDLPKEIPRTKSALRDFLRGEDRESEWIAFQAELYGPGMAYAEPFNGALETMRKLELNSYKISIISHRSLYPYSGPKYNLHSFAKNWVSKRLKAINSLHENSIFFLQTKREKINKIGEIGCEYFLDDLPEILKDPEFPSDVKAILFNPVSQSSANISENEIFFTCKNWSELPALIEKLK